MATFKPTEEDHVRIQVDDKPWRLIKREVFDKFNSALLGLGDIKQEAVGIDAIAAVFDLQGFTNFCKQIEPHLSVPIFLSDFLGWLMERLKEEAKEKEYEEGILLYSPLPFLVKFMGDGLLVLWDAGQMTESNRRNVIASCDSICRDYRATFLVGIEEKVSDPPPALRCGVARGMVYSVGDGNDYVGSCINMAARLENLPGVTIAFNLRGFNLYGYTGYLRQAFVIKQVSVRGIGERELVGIRQADYDGMAPEDKAVFRDVGTQVKH